MSFIRDAASKAKRLSPGSNVSSIFLHGFCHVLISFLFSFRHPDLILILGLRQFAGSLAHITSTYCITSFHSTVTGNFADSDLEYAEVFQPQTAIKAAVRWCNSSDVATES
ncbi:MAG: hypothetical protein FRX49_02884 [Trebouxia sp. A1-2]|nr:MAG: hypothetical protein FRX49_02884 [Trebouxia sp. A1-2]